MEWQPIDTAPRRQDEAVLLWWAKEETCVMGYWSPFFGGIWESWEEGRKVDATHWMPLPKGPA